MSIAGWVDDRAAENRVYNPRTGKWEASWWDRAVAPMFGGNPNAAVREAVDTEKRDAGRKILEGAGISLADTNLTEDTLTESSATRAVRIFDEGKEDDKFNRNLKASLEPLKLSIKQQSEALGSQERLTRAQMNQSNNQFKIQEARMLAQMKDSNNLAIMQLQQNSQDRLAELEYRKMADRKEDQRYNERMDELDRKDRRGMMQNMAMGIAALGAAFAL